MSDRNEGSPEGVTMTLPLSDARLGAMLAEDVPYGDLTTLGIGDAAGRATFRTRSTMTPTYKRKNVKRVYTDAEIKEAVEATDNLHQATKLLGINKGNYGRFRRFVPESPRSTQPF
jgi:nicotinate-nucleotide pyrophosphorylase